MVAKFVTHASAHSTYLINGFIFVTSALMHSTCTRKPTESPDPSFPVCDTESDPRWGWLGLACETKSATIYAWMKFSGGGCV